jgi:UDP-GlcNAc:undecaprenyl-phosphate/decaprenyl-phosphate GlcNAc-1-phosphate transferase
VAPTIVLYISFFSFLWIFLNLGYGAVVQFLTARKMVCSNYQGNPIPTSVGILIPITNIAAFPWVFGKPYEETFIIQMVCLGIMSYVGWRDDRLGGEEAKGIKGHVRYVLKERRLSMGLWKALTGCGLAACLSAVFSSSLWLFVMHWLIISLLTNLINLFDLRPGRALKGYFLLFILLLGLSYRMMPFPLWFPTVFTACFLFQKDLKGMIMLGDAGSNVLGMVLGFWIVLYAPLLLKIVVAVIAITVHIYAEKKSISQLIQSTSLLHWLDMLGR